MKALILTVLIIAAEPAHSAMWHGPGATKDKLTDKTNYQVHQDSVADRGETKYRLTVNCTTDSYPKLQIAAFMPKATGKAIPFSTKYNQMSNQYVQNKSIKLRIDDNKPVEILLEQTYSNAGTFSLGQTVDGVVTLLMASRGILAASFDLGMPRRRLILAEVLPGEIVEFDFSTFPPNALNFCSQHANQQKTEEQARQRAALEKQKNDRIREGIERLEREERAAKETKEKCWQIIQQIKDRALRTRQRMTPYQKSITLTASSVSQVFSYWDSFKRSGQVPSQYSRDEVQKYSYFFGGETLTDCENFRADLIARDESYRDQETVAK